MSNVAPWPDECSSRNREVLADQSEVTDVPVVRHKIGASSPVTGDDCWAEDEILMMRLGNREDAALACLYDRHAPAAYALAFRILWNRQLAEEAVQEAYLALWQAAASYQPERGSVRSLLMAIVRYRAIDLLRGSQTQMSRTLSLDVFGLPLPVAADDPARDALRRIEAEDVRSVLASLPPEQRTVIDLAYFGGLSHSQIANHLRLPVGTVKSRMRLAMERLRAAMLTHGRPPAHADRQR